MGPLEGERQWLQGSRHLPVQTAPGHACQASLLGSEQAGPSGETWPGVGELLPAWDPPSCASCSSPLPFPCSVADCFADGDQPWASPCSCFRSFHCFESGSRTFCSPKTNSGAVSIPASGPSQRHHIRSSLQSGPHLYRTVPLSAVNCLEIHLAWGQSQVSVIPEVITQSISFSSASLCNWSKVFRYKLAVVLE